MKRQREHYEKKNTPTHRGREKERGRKREGERESEREERERLKANREKRTQMHENKKRFMPSKGSSKIRVIMRT